MTADIRTAAQREVERIMPFDGGGMDALRAEWRNAFPLGAVWAAKRVTPTREQVAKEIYETHPNALYSWEDLGDLDKMWPLRAADAVLALMQELSTREDHAEH